MFPLNLNEDLYFIIITNSKIKYFFFNFIITSVIIYNFIINTTYLINLIIVFLFY